MENILTKLGVNLLENHLAHFGVWAPNAKEVYVMGDFNEWADEELLMANSGDGCWELEVKNVAVGQGYKFVIVTHDGHKIYRNDPYARQLTNSIGNSLIPDLEFDWEEADEFEIEDLNKLIIYELHIGTFNKLEDQEVGDFYSAAEKLPYLKDLGINLIEVMPASEFPGDYSWGYNPAHPFAIESAYGGPKGFKHFVKKAHQLGMGVIMDVVYNHFGPTDMDLWQFDGWSENGLGGIYFYNDWKAKTPWGDTRPDYGRQEVRQYIFDNAFMWLEEYKCDGLRMDMVPYIRNVFADGSVDNSIEEGKTLIQWINSEIIAKYPRKFLVAEDLHTLDEITKPTFEGGFGYTSQWCAAFVHPIRELLITQEDVHRNLYSAEAAILKKYNNDVFQRVIYTESHDEVANGKARVAEEIAVDDVNNFYSVKRSMLAATLVMTAPGIPMIFQGQEMLEDGYFDDGDPIEWKLTKKYKGFVQYFKDLISLRSNVAEGTMGLQSQFCETIHLNNEDKILVFHRFDKKGPQDSVIVIINFSGQSQENYQISLPFEANWELVLASDAEVYSPHSTPAPVKFSIDDATLTATLASYSAMIFTCS